MNQYVFKLGLFSFLVIGTVFGAEKWCTDPVTALPGGITHESYPSALAGTDICYNIFLPPGYATSGKKYPVIYNLHGVSQFENAIPPLIGSKLAPWITAQEVGEFIMVFPNGVGDSWYCGIVEKTLMEELIPHIDKKYRTYGANGRSIEGFSMGGYGALKLGLKNPDKFKALVSLSGAYSNGCPAEYPNDEFNGDINQIISKYGAAALAKNIKIRITAGKNEGPLFDEYAEMISFLDDEDITVDFEAISGIGHSLQDTYDKVGKKGLNFQLSALTNIRERARKFSGTGGVGFKDNSHLVLGLLHNQTLSLSVYDLKGRLLELVLDRVNLEPGSHQFQLTSPLAQGMYAIVVSNPKKQSWTKLDVLF